ncbi:ABC transporter permease [Brachybacterium huguangmaarense]|uniref:Oligopeptide transport system permease protein OppC n=1 Tax=Brachybacterium huguangmaarense TaxID=1652028 RepID=A0ABY6G1Q6_9MICO|nr:ABC transporter permease [Brachybacterium huguangmaarense]UYG17140.1 ABC transporter permease [Brachybacterium huguangmaarense]
MTNPGDIRTTEDATRVDTGYLTHGAEPLPDEHVDDVVGREGDPVERIKSMGRGELLRRRFLRNPLAWTGMIIFAVLVLMAIFAPMVYTHGPFELDLRADVNTPTADHWFGLTDNGWDTFSRCMHGLRISLVIGIGTAILTSIIAVLVGTVAGYVSGKGRLGNFVDSGLVNLINLFLVVPSLLLLMLFGPKLQNASWLWMIPLLAGFAWMLTARVLRAMTQQLVRTEYVEAAKFMGVNPVVNVVRHVIPNVASWIIIDTTLGVGAAVLAETGLSFIGFGIQMPQVSLGTVLQSYELDNPWTWAPAATILALLVISINLMGEALRDALDPTSGSSRV